MSEWGYSTHDKGGYFFDAKAEKKSWVELAEMNREDAVVEAKAWAARLAGGHYSLRDASLPAVLKHVGSLIDEVDRLGGAA